MLYAQPHDQFDQFDQSHSPNPNSNIGLTADHDVDQDAVHNPNSELNADHNPSSDLNADHT